MSNHPATLVGDEDCATPYQLMKCKRCDGTGDEPNQKAIGARNAMVRATAGIGLREMAGYMGISHGYLSQLEGGTRTWSRSLTQRFSRQLTKHTKPT